MDKDIIEVRWHGRGGQGAKTAALLFADALLNEETYIQAFPEYGPERMGAPVQSFNRISKKPITLHCGITNPDMVVVLDCTLMDTVDVAAGIPENGIIVANTSDSPEEVRKRLNLKGRKVYSVNATAIAQETIGKPIPNTPMMGALVRVSKIVEIDKMLAEVEKKLGKKFRGNQKIVDGNMAAIKRAFEEVKEEAPPLAGQGAK